MTVNGAILKMAIRLLKMERTHWEREKRDNPSLEVRVSSEEKFKKLDGAIKSMEATLKGKIHDDNAVLGELEALAASELLED